MWEKKELLLNMYKYIMSNKANLIENNRKQIYHLPELIHPVTISIGIYT